MKWAFANDEAFDAALFVSESEEGDGGGEEGKHDKPEEEGGVDGEGVGVGVCVGSFWGRVEGGGVDGGADEAGCGGEASGVVVVDDGGGVEGGDEVVGWVRGGHCGRCRRGIGVAGTGAGARG